MKGPANVLSVIGTALEVQRVCDSGLVLHHHSPIILMGQGA